MVVVNVDIGVYCHVLRHVTEARLMFVLIKNVHVVGTIKGVGINKCFGGNCLHLHGGR